MEQPLLPGLMNLQQSDGRLLQRLIQRSDRALRDAMGGSPVERLDALVAILIAKIYDEIEWEAGHKPRPEFVPGGGGTAARLGAVYTRALDDLFADLPGSDSGFVDNDLAVNEVAGVLAPYRLRDSFHDVKGSAFQEMLRGTFDKNDYQQFFTPPEVAAFMADVAEAALGPTLASAKVCDPAVGTGGLLLGIVRKVLAGLGGDQSAGARYLRDCIYGVDCEARMAWLAAANLVLTGGGPARCRHIPGGGSLDRRRPELAEGTFDLVITNPPFGSDVVDPAILEQYKVGRGRGSRRRSCLFVERCLNLLRPEGFVVMIVDDSILNQPTTADVRAVLRGEAEVRAVFSLPNEAFMPYASVKASILVAQRRPTGAGRPALFVVIEHTGRRPNGDTLWREERGSAGERVLDNDLPAAADAWVRHLRGHPADDNADVLAFTVTNEDYGRVAADDRVSIDSARLDVLRQHPAAQRAAEALATSPHPVRTLGTLVQVGRERVTPCRSPDERLRFIGLADIAKWTGDFVPQEVFGDSVLSTCFRFQPGDVLYALMRPNLRKVVYIPPDDPGGICSSECLVLRPKPSVGLDPAYLAWFLRSELAYGQLLGQVTGLGRPRVSPAAVLAVRVPVPPVPVQRDLVARLDDSHHGLVQAQRRADEQVRTAQHEFRRALDTAQFLMHATAGVSK